MKTGYDVDHLTPQEIAVLRASWDGLTRKETAARLGLSELTIKGYRSKIYDKFGVENVEGMLRRGLELGYLDLHAPRAAQHMEDWP